jgi:hypothetical protein
MIIIAFDGRHLLGGYGDRVVGIIACKAIAKLLNREFRILWKKENITSFIDITGYSIDTCPPNAVVYNLIDRQSVLKEVLKSHPTPIVGPVAKIYLNQEIAQYVYSNPRFQKKKTTKIEAAYYSDMFALYRSLYTDILKPTAQSLRRVEAVCAGHTNIIGIQVRTGDIYIKNDRNPNAYVAISDVPTTVLQLLNGIKSHMGDAEYSVFITSDYDNIRAIAETVWSPSQILTNEDSVQHIDRPVSGDFSKFYVDNFILSQRTRRLYVSDYSNYGRVAALSATHDDLWNLRAQPLDKALLLSKHDQVFGLQS